MKAVLDVRALEVRGHEHQILHPLSFTIRPGEILGVTGESGSGKSTLALALMGLLPTGFRAYGSAALQGTELLSLSERDLCRLRGKTLVMVFQEPMTALNPTRAIGQQIADTLRLHTVLSRSQIRAETRTLLQQTGLLEAGISESAYPHELSGGQRQRVLLAMALACRPSLLIADEFTTALDPQTRNAMMDLVRHHCDTHGMAVLMVSHDLGLIHRHTAHVLVLKDGACVEQGSTSSVFDTPSHAYTQALLAMSLHGAGRAPLTPLPVFGAPA